MGSDGEFGVHFPRGGIVAAACGTRVHMLVASCYSGPADIRLRICFALPGLLCYLLYIIASSHHKRLHIAIGVGSF